MDDPKLALATVACHPCAFRGTKAGQAPAAGTAVSSREHPSGPRLEVSRPKGPKTFKTNLLSEGLHILHSPGFPVLSTWLLSIFRFQESKENCIKLFSLLQEMLQRAVRGRAEQKLGFRWGREIWKQHGDLQPVPWGPYLPSELSTQALHGWGGNWRDHAALGEALGHLAAREVGGLGTCGRAAGELRRCRRISCGIGS